MTHCTPAQAREEADLLCSAGLGTPGFMLRSLADQLEALTAERDVILEAAEEWSRYVVEDTAPRTLSDHLQLVIDAARSKQ